jgi:hypothetical protein
LTVATVGGDAGVPVEILLAVGLLLLLCGVMAWSGRWCHVEAFRRERPAGTRVSRLVIAPWIHRLLAVRFGRDHS